VGAGIGVWPRIWKILAQLGLDEDLARVHAVKPTLDLSERPLFPNFAVLFYSQLTILSRCFHLPQSKPTRGPGLLQINHSR
jgi:hypothetical protein